MVQSKINLNKSNYLNGVFRYPLVVFLFKNYLVSSNNSIKLLSDKSLVIQVNLNKIKQVLIFLKNSWFLKFNLLMDLWAVDWPSRFDRFEINYNLLSLKFARRLYIRVFSNEWSGVYSVMSVFSSANWLEREVWDMYGILFFGHNDLRRILTDYGFVGHPLRKEFPLSGYVEHRYDDTVRRVVSEGLNLIQELRLFFFAAPWRKLSNI